MRARLTSGANVDASPNDGDANPNAADANPSGLLRV